MLDGQRRETGVVAPSISGMEENAFIGGSGAYGASDGSRTGGPAGRLSYRHNMIRFVGRQEIGQRPAFIGMVECLP